MNQILQTLEPKLVWQHFRTLCNTPRPSYHEAPLRQLLIDWAHSLDLVTYVDPVGNLLIKKAATLGMENRATVVLQGHLDMVAQKNANIEHDFTKDPILTEIIDGWVHAKDTTLGADNGIGVAAALAVLESTDIAHGPIEALFTIEEESSLRGALELEAGILDGKILFNLDSEDRGDVYIGCAGGTDINVAKEFASQDAAADDVGFNLSISGLRGGHSGLDIHKGLANANVLLATLLLQLTDEFDIRLASFSGGTLRNAIAREANACFMLPTAQVDAMYKQLAHWQSAMKTEFSITEAKLTFTLEPSPVKATMQTLDQQRLLCALNCAPHGVFRMSPELPGVTETSCNLGVLNLMPGKHGKLVFSGCLLVRSLLDSATTYMARKAKAAFDLIGASVIIENGYPGWRPDPTAGLLKQFLAVHQDVMGYEANVKVIHAGLECGIIGAKYPGMEMVSFGPNIRGAHSPAERLEIDSVGDFWRLLVELLAAVPLSSAAAANVSHSTVTKSKSKASLS